MIFHNKPDQQLCDDVKLIAVLNDDDHTADHTEVIEHIEHCSRCQQRFDELAAGAQDWTKVRQALLNDDPCSENRVGSAKWDYSLRNEGPVAWTESMASQLLSPASHPELLGRIGRYDVERLIGSGGMGVVFKAHDSELNRPVAIKILAPYLSSSGPARKRFAREARAAAAVVHEHVVPIYNVETEREIPFLVMHYIAGESLQSRIDREGALELCEILRIGMQVASGLSAAHQQGLVHRDIKPSNILMEQGVERALITDFGLARAADDASLTRTGFHPGTPQYMSPEQAAGEQVDARSDLFSLGSVLYTMCTGRPPFRAETSLGVLRRITDVEPRPIREINPNIPEWLSSLVARLMSKSPEDRFANALEVADLLGQCLAHVQQPAGMPLPVGVQALAAQAQLTIGETFERNRLKAGHQRVPLKPNRLKAGHQRKFIAAAALVFALVFAGVFIVLESNKGTLTIQTEADDIRVRITQGDEVIDELKVTKSGQSVRVAAGQYKVEILGKTDELTVDNELVTLHRSGNEVVRIVRKTNGKSERQTTSKQLSAYEWQGKLQGSWNFSKSELDESAEVRGTVGSEQPTSRSVWELKQVFNPAHDQMVWSVAFNPDGTTIASAGADKKIKFWDVASGSLRSTLFRPVNCTDVAFSPDGNYLAIAGGDDGENPPGELVLIDMASGKEEFVLESHETARYSKSVAFSSDGKWLASGGSDKLVKIWSVEQRSLHIELPGHTELVSQVAFSPDGKLLASASFDRNVKLWSVPDGKAIATLRGHDKEVRGVAFSPDGNLLVSVSEDGTARLWNARSGESLGVMDGGGPMFSIAFAPDGRNFATGSRGSPGVTIWDVNTHNHSTPVVRLQQAREIMSLTFSADGRMLAIVGGWNGFHIRDQKAVITEQVRSSYLPERNAPDAHVAAAEKEYQQLQLAEEDLRAAYDNAIERAKSDDDRERAEKQFDARDAYTPKYLAFEEKYRGTPAGLKALIKVIGFARSILSGPAPAGRVEAVDRLIDHYVAFDGVEQAFDHLRGGLPVPREKELLKAVLEKNPSRHVQAESLIAQLELIRVTLSRHANIEALRERVLHPEEHHPEFWRENDKAVLQELESTNPDQLRAEMKSIIERLEEFSFVPVAKYGMAYKAARHLSHSINKVVIGKPAPEIKAITSVGKQFQLSKLRGSTVLLVFGLNHSSDNDVMYAPLRKLAEDYKSRHVEVVMILESDEDKFQSAAALKRQFPWTVIQVPSAGSLSLDWGIRAYPTVFFIDPKGILQSWTVGLPCYDDDSGYDATEVAAELDRLLNGKPKDTEQTSQPPVASDVNDKRLGLSPKSEEHPMESSAGHKSCPFCEIESKTIRQEIQASATWAGELPGSEELNAYIAAIRALPDSSPERFKFYWSHLEHANETIAEDSSKEVAFAMHEYWNTGERPFEFKQFVDLNQVRLWLKDAHVPEHRRRVYIRLLGIVGIDEDTEVLKRTISNAARQTPNTNLQAQIEACVLLGGPTAWDFVEQEILLTPGVPDTNVYAMILAVRFFDSHSKLISRDRLLQSLHLMLDRPALADIVVRELIRMKDWSQVERLVGLLKSSDENSKWVRHPIVQYLQACPFPEAANELAKLKEISKAVERVLQQPRKTSNTGRKA